jgi:NAD(P)-dependent dehydrogenase (short-subunit alcohol dehydrogenase family)
MNSLPGVLVAGGTGALGTAVVRELLESGYPVTATWVVQAERDRVREDLADHESLALVEADLMDPAVAESVVAGVEGLRAVVNLVGGYAETGRVHETDPDDFDRLIALNLKPLFLLARAAMPRLAEAGGGSFVGVSARPALRPFPGATSYATAKAAVLALIQALDVEWRSHSVRANAVLPSVIDTPANRRSEPDADYSKWVPPSEIAKVIRFLVSDDSAVTSGAAIPVYGRA